MNGIFRALWEFSNKIAFIITITKVFTDFYDLIKIRATNESTCRRVK